MAKYFPATARHAKTQEFLDLRQGTMTVLEYVARFTELARFADDYVAIDMAKVRKFKNGLKLSIRGKIVGLRLQDMDSMVETVVTIERDVKLGALGMRVHVERGRRVSLLPVRERSRGLLVHVGSKAAVLRAKDRSKLPVKQDRWYVFIANSSNI